MSRQTPQAEQWDGEFGKAFTDRNLISLEEMDDVYRRQVGVARSEMNARFLGGLDRSLRILEVGSNVGNQLWYLQRMGFTELYGVELSHYALELSKQRTSRINLIQGSAFDLPFKDGFFDLVFTSVVLIHISPKDIRGALAEIHRCSRRYIWGYEYAAESYTEVEYRGKADLLWKTDFAQLYLDTFPGLRLVKQERFPYREGGNVDAMFLLEKTGR